MDPISVLSIINGSFGLVSKLSDVIAQIYKLRSIYKHAELSLQSLSSQCRALRLAVSCIRKDLQIRQHTAEASISDAVAAELQANLDTSEEVLDGLEKELESLNKKDAGVSRNTKVTWEIDCLKDHENRVRGQIHCWTMLLQILDR
jgi:chromosome segregation ATPase